MSRFAGRVLKRYGDTDKAYEAFLEHAKKCDPPLSERELKTIWSSAVKFFQKSIVNQEGYVPPEEYNADFEGASLKPEDYSDIGQAKVLVREYGDELKYTNATDFLRFDGECWREDKQMAIGAVEEFLDLQLQDAMDEVARAEDALEAAGVPRAVINAGVKELQKEADEKQMPLVFMLMGAQTYLKFVQKRRDYKYIVSAANTAKPMIAISVCDLDRNEFFINTPVATFDLRKGLAGELPHDPGDLITKITACSPGDEGMQLWLDALELFFCKDQSLIDYVQETVGMAAIGKVYQEHMIIAYGGGANGKSTFWNTIFRVLGNYAGKLSAEALTMSCKRNVKPEMAELKGKRLIISSEMEEGMRLNTAVVKQLCSTDEIQAEKKYKDPFSFVPSHTLVLYTNHLPKVGANDDGIWRRLIVIPFNAKIAGKSDIKNYADFLFEHAGSAVMSWIIEGAQKAIAKEFHTKLPQVVKDAIQAYREDNDWLGQFLEECCEVDPSYKEKSGEIYQAYRAYCIQNGEYIRSTSDFYSSMDKAGYNRIRKNTGVQVVGLRLKEGQDFLE
jgi:P4 family phage/plasmid primase-like protien